MKLIAHRGLWKARADCNTIAAFQSAFSRGIGIETDLRSASGKLYLAHDTIKKSGSHPTFEHLVEVASKYPQLPIFLNIKEDGLLDLLNPFLPTLEKMYAVFFDMSIPELIQYAKRLPPSHLCTRISEFEPQPSAIELCDWVWVDGFYKEFNFEQLKKLTQKHKKKWAFVSPELHGRNEKPFWKKLLAAEWLDEKSTFLCTDLAEKFDRGLND